VVLKYQRRNVAASHFFPQGASGSLECLAWLRRTVRQDLSRPLVDAFFSWLTAHAARVSRKSDLGEAMAYMLRRQDGFRLFLVDGHVAIDSNLVDLFTRLANGHLDKDIGALMPWACSSAAQPEIASIPEK